MTSFKSILKIILFGIFIIQLTACSQRRSDFTHWNDSAPAHQVDINKIDDAQPKQEPRSRYGNPSSYVIEGQRYYVLANSDNYRKQGMASWYGTQFHGKRTSSGETYNMYAMTAAHKTLPLPTYVKVTNLDNGRSIVVKINDRGPFIKGRIIDLSYVAAQKIGIIRKGTGRVEVETINTNAVKRQDKTASKQEIISPPATTSPRQHQRSNLYLQVGIFNKKHNAERFRSRLTQLALPPIRVTTDTSGKFAKYRVRIGPLSTDSEAEKLIELLAREGHTGFRIRVD